MTRNAQDRRVEEREKPVAHELVDEGLVVVEHVGHDHHVTVEDQPGPFGPQSLADGGEAPKVAEETGHLKGSRRKIRQAVLFDDLGHNGRRVILGHCLGKLTFGPLFGELAV